MRKLLVLFPMLVLAACGEKPTTMAPESPTAQPPVAAAKVELNLSSPDQAVKTWWRVRDLTEADAQKSCEKQRRIRMDESSLKYSKSISTGTALANQDPPPYACELAMYSRDITEVKVESDTRAVVLAKITPATPIPAGAVLTAAQSKTRENGERYKYVLEKVGSEWKVAQTYRFWDFGDDPWKPVYEDVRTRPAHSYVYGPQ